MCSRQTRLLALRSQLCFLVCMSLVCENENNSDKFYRRNFMQAADEKLIIWDLTFTTGHGYTMCQGERHKNGWLE